VTFAIVDRVTGEEIGPFRYTRFDDADESAHDLRATGEQPRASVVEGAPEMPRRNTRRIET
jgi:hypothetical protein